MRLEATVLLLRHSHHHHLRRRLVGKGTARHGLSLLPRVALRRRPDAQTRMVLSSLLEKNTGNLPKMLSVEDKLRTLGCTGICGRSQLKSKKWHGNWRRVMGVAL